MSGTSQAAPYVTGIVATLISLGGNMSPSVMIEAVQNLSIKGVLSDLRAEGSITSNSSTNFSHQNRTLLTCLRVDVYTHRPRSQ